MRPYKILSAFIHAVASTGGGQGGQAGTLWDSNQTGLAGWDDWFGELGVHSNVVSSFTGGSLAEVGPLPTLELEFDTSLRYRLYATRETWRTDRCAFNIEFITWGGDVVAAIHSPGGTQGTGVEPSFTHELRYGPSLTEYQAAGKSGVNNTYGYLEFTEAGIVFTNTLPSNYNDSFTFSCDIHRIAKVRVSGVYAVSNYSGGGRGFVRFYRDMGSPGYLRESAMVTGVVTEGGAPVQRTVRVYSRETFALLGQSVSGVDGIFTIKFHTLGEPVFCVVLDDAGGISHNAKVFSDCPQVEVP